MYCKYCGKPVDEVTMRCKICGRPVGPLEGGNGFWDLAGDLKEETAQNAPLPEAPAQPDPAMKEKIKTLREEVEKLRKERKEQPAGKKSAASALAFLLGLLALALGVFVLFQLRGAEGRLQSLERRVGQAEAAIRAGEEARARQEQGQTEEQATAAVESKWKGVGELDGIPLQPSRNLFEGPNKGENDTRGQSIRLGYPELYDETPIFTARYIGPAGTYRYFWVKVETDENTKEVFFTPLTEEEGYVFRNPNASDTDKTYRLSIGGEVKEEHLGNYAFVVLDTQTRSASVSQIVELYDRAEQVLTQQNAPSGGGTENGSSGDGNGN